MIPKKNGGYLSHRVLELEGTLELIYFNLILQRKIRPKAGCFLKITYLGSDKTKTKPELQSFCF